MSHCIEIVALDTANQFSILGIFREMVGEQFPGMTFEYLDGRDGAPNSLIIHTYSDEGTKKMREFVASSMEVMEPRIQSPQRWTPLKHIRKPD